MKDKTKLKILNFWLENPRRIGGLPAELETKIKKDDLYDLMHELGDMGMNKIREYKSNLESSIIEKERSAREKSTYNISKGNLIIGGVTLLLLIFGTIYSIIS